MKHIEQIDDNWITRAQLAKHLKVSLRTVDRWAEKELLPPPERLTDGTVRFNFTECKRMIDKISNRLVSASQQRKRAQ